MGQGLPARIFLYVLCIISVHVSFGQLEDNTFPPDVAVLIDEIFAKNDSTTTQKPCNCIPIKNCETYNNEQINTNGAGLIDIKFGQCPNSLEICCDKVRDPSPIVTQPPYTRRNRCGFRNENGVGFKITAGNSEAQFGEFPWMIAILVKKIESSVEYFRYHCGGALIHPRVVLTAAHCVVAYVNKTDQLILRAGEWDSQSDAETIPYQEQGATKVIVHKQYVSGSLYNDIALVLLKGSFEFQENVDVICLPAQDENVDQAQCVASGWGKETFGSNAYQNILKRVDLPIVPRKECQETLRTTRLGPRFNLHASFLCAGGIPGADTCKGDGGSPLMCPIPGRTEYYQQVGIVAWGIGCGSTIPGVYTNIPFLKKWIDDKFLENNLDSAYYTN